MRRFFNPCGRYCRSICLLAADSLPEPEKDQLKNHLAGCADCRKYYNEIETVTVSLTNWDGHFTQLQPGRAVQNRWASAVRAAGQPEPVRWLTPGLVFREWWRDVIRPRRRFWAGLAVVWSVILAGNFSLHDHSQTRAAKSSLTLQETVASFKDQQKILAELLMDHSAPRDPARQKFFPPGPRTESVTISTA
jgi:hypothetical protein